MSMKAGKYWVGDLCYVLHDRWDEFCDKTVVDNNCLDGGLLLSDGTRVAQYHTAHGDGCYCDQFGNDYPVDAGLIGCIRIEDIRDNDPGRWDAGGHVHEFPKEFYTDADDGIIHIGHLVIDTNWEDNNDD